MGVEGSIEEEACSLMVILCDLALLLGIKVEGSVKEEVCVAVVLRPCAGIGQT